MDRIIEIVSSINWETVGAILTTFVGVIIMVQKWMRKHIVDINILRQDNVELKNSNIISQANIVSYNNLIQEFTQFRNTVYSLNKSNKALEAQNKQLMNELTLLMKAHEELLSNTLVEFTNRLKNIKEEETENEI